MAIPIDAVLKEEPAFYAKEFADQLSKFLALDDQQLSKIETWLLHYNVAVDLSSPGTWIEGSRQVGLPIEDLQQSLSPIGYIVSTSIKHDITVDDLLQYLTQIELYKNIPNAVLLREKCRKIAAQIFKMAIKSDEEASPSLPLSYIREMQIKTVIIPEFRDDFDYKLGNPEEFNPSVKRLYVRAVLELKFRDSKSSKLGIVLTPESLPQLKKLLVLAEKEMTVAAKHINR